MPHYHVCINELDEVYELDLTREFLLRYIVEPYLKNEEFFCGGTRIDPSEIEKIKISETEKPSKELIPEARPKYTSLLSMFSQLSDEEITMREGMDVTRQLITHLPMTAKQRARAPQGMKNESFIKLTALEKSVSHWLNVFHRGVAHYFDPKEVMDLFKRFDSIRSQLQDEYPTYFADLPTREVKPSGTPDFEGRGYIQRGALEILHGDINYCINIFSETKIFDEARAQVGQDDLLHQ
jgi:hypothetical protein